MTQMNDEKRSRCPGGRKSEEKKEKPAWGFYPRNFMGIGGPLEWSRLRTQMYNDLFRKIKLL